MDQGNKIHSKGGEAYRPLTIQSRKALMAMGAFASACLLVLVSFTLAAKLEKASGGQYGPQFRATSTAAYVAFGPIRLDTYVARTDDELGKGLSGRAGLDKNAAMLFAFQHPGNYGVWMLGMSFSIDVLWLDSSGTIIKEVAGMPPQSYPQAFYAGARTAYVVELPDGTIGRLGLRTGQGVTSPLIARQL